MAESLKGATGNSNVPAIDVNAESFTREDFDKLRQDVNDLRAQLEKSLNLLRQELDQKAGLHDLANMQAILMDKLNELMANLEGMFADKEGTRKKFAQLEKAVSIRQTNLFAFLD